MDKITKESILVAAQRFEEAWNNRDLETACELYAEDALYITRRGVVCGREAILKTYQDNYHNQETMGKLSLTLGYLPVIDKGKFAVAVFRREIKDDSEVTQVGYTLENYAIVDGKLLLVQDASM